MAEVACQTFVIFSVFFSLKELREAAHFHEHLFQLGLKIAHTSHFLTTSYSLWDYPSRGGFPGQHTVDGRDPAKHLGCMNPCK